MPCTFDKFVIENTDKNNVLRMANMDKEGNIEEF